MKQSRLLVNHSVHTNTTKRLRCGTVEHFQSGRRWLQLWFGCTCHYTQSFISHDVALGPRIQLKTDLALTIIWGFELQVCVILFFSTIYIINAEYGFFLHVYRFVMMSVWILCWRCTTSTNLSEMIQLRALFARFALCWILVPWWSMFTTAVFAWL